MAVGSVPDGCYDMLNAMPLPANIGHGAKDGVAATMGRFDQYDLK
jgi:hypothetical protein